MGPRNQVLDGVQIPHGKGRFWGDKFQFTVTYLRMSALRIIRLKHFLSFVKFRVKQINFMVEVRRLFWISKFYKVM